MCNKAFPEPGRKCCATCGWCMTGRCMQWEVDQDGQLGVMGNECSPGMHHLWPPPGFSCHLHKEHKDARVWRVWSCIDRPGVGDLAQGNEWYRLEARNLDEARRLCDYLNEHCK